MSFRQDETIFDEIIAKEGANLSPSSSRFKIYKALFTKSPTPFFLQEPQQSAFHKALALANIFIDDKGKLNFPVINEAHALLTQTPYLLNLNLNLQKEIFNHFKLVISVLALDKEAQQELNMIQKPTFFPKAEQLIRMTLQLKPHTQVEDVHAKRAVLCAWLTFLRQNVGCCFATAPACLIQRFQPRQFLQDLNELLSLGWLKRVKEGFEYIAPLCPSLGIGLLARPLPVSLVAQIMSSQPPFIAAFDALGIVSNRIAEVVNQLIQEIRIDHFLSAQQVFKFFLQKNLGLSGKEIELWPQDMSSTSQISGINHSKATLFHNKWELVVEIVLSHTDNILLRAWEYTLASFTESQAHFTKWNLYYSLGMDHNQPEGVAFSLYNSFNEQLKTYQEQALVLQDQYEKVFLEIKALESMAHVISTESKMQWVRSQYSSRFAEYSSLLDQRDDLFQKASALSQAFSPLIEKYFALFPLYFQEVFDPDMADIQTDFFEDAPAGFRLLYKHGRAHPKTWNLIYSAEEFVDSLINFFQMTEPAILDLEGFKGLEKELSVAITTLIHFLRQPEFIQSAISRLSQVHQADFVKAPQKKPWAFTSGGTIGSLVQGYYGLPQELRHEGRSVERTAELLAFIIDTLREILFDTNRGSGVYSLLMSSPTHAFVLLANAPLLTSVWTDTYLYSYTWIKNQFENPRVSQIENYLLDPFQIDWILSALQPVIPIDGPVFFSTIDRNIKSIPQLYHAIKNLVEGFSFPEEWQKEFLAKARSFIYSNMPLISSSNFSNRIVALAESTFHITEPQVPLSAFENNISSTSFYTPTDLLRACMAFLALHKESVFSTQDDQTLLLQQMAIQGDCWLPPLIFADSNWTIPYLGFVIDPCTLQLELFRLTSSGLQGSPMTMWEPYLNGQSSLLWIIYNNPNQFNFH